VGLLRSDRDAEAVHPVRDGDFRAADPLAVTSFDIWKVRLGKNWKRLHQLVYVIAPLPCCITPSREGDIFRLQGDIVRPLIYALIILILLLLRLPAIRRFIASRNRLGGRAARSAPPA